MLVELFVLVFLGIFIGISQVALSLSLVRRNRRGHYHQCPPHRWAGLQRQGKHHHNLHIPHGGRTCLHSRRPQEEDPLRQEGYRQRLGNDNFADGDVRGYFRCNAFTI